MKNTMKKLLCMALVIMLLVSAVPVFAMADELPDDGKSYVDVVDGFAPEGAGVVDDDSSADYSAGASDTNVVPEGLEQEGTATKIYAYLYTGAEKEDGTISRVGDAGSWSSSTISSATELATILNTYLKQGNRDPNGIATFQKYSYKMKFGKNALTNGEDWNDVTGTVEDVDVQDGARYVHFIRVPLKVTVTLQLEDSDFRANPFDVTIFSVLDLPKTFAKNGLKADAGKYICSYTLDGSTNPLGNTYRVSENVTIVGHQDLLTNKADNDASGVGQPNGATGGTTGGTTTGGSSGNSSANGSTGSNKFPYPVYLNIYKDTLVGSPDKRVEITKGAALDGTVTLSEVKNVVKNYYTAKDSDGISYDGLYIAEGNWVADYVADTAKYDSIDAGTMRQTGTVYINVMIGNAKAKSSSTADASNPKTGDAIFVPMMVMGLTGTALAAAYVFGKKRIAR